MNSLKKKHTYNNNDNNKTKNNIYTKNKLFTIFFCLFSLFSMSNSNTNTNIKNIPFSSFIEVSNTNTNTNNNNNNAVDNSKIEGKMTINGEEYNTICDCNPVTPVNTNDPLNQVNKGPKCDPSKLRIHQEKKGQGASFDEIRGLIGNIEELNYIVVPEISFKCLDGRYRNGIIGTPGGDAGEFILALIVYEDMLSAGKKLTQDNVDYILKQYLKTMIQPRFYMCTDDSAINHIQKEMNVK
jgi:hypothetical protein